MHLVYPLLFPAMWLAWALYWWASSRNVKATVWRESVPSRLLHIVPLMLATLLLSVRLPIAILNARLLPATAAVISIGALMTALGLAITVWARLHLGRNWSGTVTLKADHELITDGPYAFVRHPIYTGLLLGFAGSAIACGEARGVLALAIVGLALWRKLRLEEHGMRRQFGGAYQAYSQNVAALIPLLL